MCSSRPAIEVSSLSKRFDGVVAVDQVSFTVERGSICALLGGNGAGKTTTIAMLLGLIIPDAGSIHMLGKDMLTNRYAVLPRINFSSPYVDLPQRLSVRENLDVYARLYGVNKIKQRIDELATDLDLHSLLKRGYGTLSAGQKTRVALAKALLNTPEMLLLDEPTASLDPDTADRLRGYLQNYQAMTNATFLIASHNMQEVERLCSDVMIMRAGKIVDRGSPTELLTRFGRADLEEVFLDIARNRTSGAVTRASA
jgi:ABC-2 type transport system ATP-binding protein